ncbi:MAG: dienelactone hydrolase family protein [Kofleriaceae bacterium]|nr:dienelactone hydrolase family protein [Myxococcales bacterium]MCB9564154.1 dienelactone hydrolase family protein [Kofleriaceae bacterium]MCB9572478.1 dienelactone hydrolase family protein [Kofleriaceae bacterium]
MLTIEEVRFGQGGSGYLAWPTRARAPLPAVVVLHEAAGLDDHVVDVTRRVAAAGYVALAPDLYARDSIRPEALTRERIEPMVAVLDELPFAQAMDPAARAAAFEAHAPGDAARLQETCDAMFAAAADVGDLLPTALAAVRYLRDEVDASRGQPVAALGFCMGGTLVGRVAAADPALAAAVVFYGRAPGDDEVAAIRCPVLGCYGEDDPRVNASVDGLEAAATRHGVAFTRVVHAGAGHAFFNDTRSTYVVGAARAAWVRTLGFLLEHLT